MGLKKILKKDNSTSYSEVSGMTKEVYAPFISDLKDLIKGIFFNDKEQEELDSNSISHKFYNTTYAKVKKEKKSKKYTTWEKISFLTIALTTINLLYIVWAYVDALTNLRKKVAGSNWLYIFLMVAIPIIVWIRSTNEDYFAFRKRKRSFFYLTIVNALLLLVQPIYNLIRNFLVPIIVQWPINPLMTQRKVILCCYIGVCTVFFFATYFLWLQIEPLIMSKLVQRQLDIFKLRHILDDRKDAEFLYDIKSIYNLETGKPIIIKENDRLVHTLVNGSSGTGKTSSVFMSAIRDDLDKKIKNRELREAALLKMVLDKKATIDGPIRTFSEYSIIPLGKTKEEKEANKKEIEQIRKKYKDCGMTVMAPNNDLITNIIRLCEARNIKVNVVDPLNRYEDKYSNVKDVGISPFYIPLGLDDKEDERQELINSASNAFSDIITAINDMGGNQDPYFEGVSQSVCINIACIVMLCKNIQGEQASIDDVQKCINNFELLKDYVAVIKAHFNILEEEGRTEEKKNNSGISAETIAAKINNNPNGVGINKELSKKNFQECPYREQLTYVETELLGENGKKMFDQARGLRNLVTLSIQNLSVKALLSASDKVESTRDRIAIDFDRILKENEITVVNTAKNISPTASSFIGLFFLLNMSNAILRRPPETRTPHFMWIDEASGYCHPVFDDIISYYRQFGIACTFTLQTLKQVTKNNATAYLKDVFLGCGTHIVFGRQSPDEMKIYSEMCGANLQETEVRTDSGTSVFEKNTSMSHSVRVTTELVNNLEGTDIRTTDFQELTLITLSGGRVIPGAKARVFFIRQDSYDTKKTSLVDWKSVVPSAFMVQSEEEETTEKQKVEVKEAINKSGLTDDIARVITSTEDKMYDDEGDFLLTTGEEDQEEQEEVEEQDVEKDNSSNKSQEVDIDNIDSDTDYEKKEKDEIERTLDEMDLGDIFEQAMKG